jgi:tetratricopeptide (TPR) repeat protein
MSQALIFSSFGAYQSAYRLLHDAETFCNEKNLQQLHADVVGTIATISMEEADFSFAEKTFKAAFSFYQAHHKKIPYRHLFNWGTLLIRLGKYPEAEDIYKKLKSDYAKFKDPRIDLNLAVAYKNQQKYNLAITVLKEIEDRIDPANNSEWIIEFHLIHASALALTSKYEESSVALTKCVFRIEQYLSTIFRFHYRRGIRGIYYRRIVSILEILLPKITPLKLLNILVYLKTNSQSDWLSVIEWVGQINNNLAVEIEDKEKLTVKFNNLLNFGV